MYANKSSFGYGVGVGIMYMMSAGKAEMDILNTALDQTTKVVLELNAEISKRKSLYDFKDERNVNHKRPDIKAGQASFGNDDIIEDYAFPMSHKGGYASSILTEEPHRGVVEMGQLEAELEFELLKLQGPKNTMVVKDHLTMQLRMQTGFKTLVRENLRKKEFILAMVLMRNRSGYRSQVLVLGLLSKVLAGLLNMADGADWRNCKLSKEEEIKTVERFKISFEEYNPNQ